MTQPKNVGKKSAILSRTNHLHHLRDLSLFLHKLKSCFTREQVEQLGGAQALNLNFLISFAPGEAATAIELTDHILLRVNNSERRVTGLTLLDSSRIAQTTEIGPRSFPLMGLDQLSLEL